MYRLNSKEGTLVMKFSPAAFLMFHKHTLAYYEKSSRLTAISHFKRDKNNLIVEESLSIKPITNDKVEIETDPGNMVQFTGSSCSPDTLVKTVQINRNLEKSPKSDPYCGNSKDMQQDHTGKQVHTAQQQSTNIGALRNNSSPILQTDNNSIKQPKQTGPKKQKTLKQDDLKSKLAVAEAHIAALENTILDNNNLIRNMKLTQLGQNDYHQNGPDLHSYRQTPSSISANCSNCHCSQVDNRIRDLEREMSNLRLQHLENQFFTLRQQSQNLVNLQATAHMNQQGPVHTIHFSTCCSTFSNFSAKPLVTTTSSSLIPADSSSSTTLYV
ncbi:Hypothetical predicted protein [Mytilus galloprovincialis]|uniref:Uncharacterized protein n=1 Tax=Mytilus galloprovincialis TaxID=29158 RepID=A0A8B6EBW6_MYTGA|nr:Hypothetical predicted protein [Mytilus galloprovincialis]